MSEWWTYSLSDFLLFSPRTYYRLFDLYNADLWPAHVLALAIGLAILALMVRGGDDRWSRVAGGLLGACCLWVAWAFLFNRYATINWSATWFGGLFVVQAVLLALAGAAGGVESGSRLRRLGAVALFTFALLIQPLIGPLMGRPWTQAEVFGMAPDPTALGTLGFALLAPRAFRTRAIQRRDAARTRARRPAAGRIRASGAPIVQSVAPEMAHHSSGTTSSSQRRPAAGSSNARPRVPTAVGSGAMPKTSAWVQGRPMAAPISGWISRAKTNKATAPAWRSRDAGAIPPPTAPASARSAAWTTKTPANQVAAQLIVA